MSDHAQAGHRSTKGHEAFGCPLAPTNLARLGAVRFVAPPSTLADKEKDGRPKHTLTNSIGTEVGAATADPRFNAGLVTNIATQTTDQPDKPRHYLFPRYALEQPRDPDELATRDQPPLAIPQSSAEASPTPHSDALQLHQTKPTRKDRPQILRRSRPYDPAAIRASTRTSRAGAQPCHREDHVHEKRHCPQNKRCTLCNSPGHAPSECLFPHSNCRPAQPCRVGTKHAHAHDNDGCPWPGVASGAPRTTAHLTQGNTSVNLTYARAERHNAWNKIVPESESTSTIAITANVSAPTQEDDIPTGAATSPTPTASVATKSPTATTTLRISKRFASNFIPTITRTTSPSTTHPISSRGLLADLVRAHKSNDKNILEGPTQTKSHGNITPDPARRAKPDLESHGLHRTTHHQRHPRFPGPLTVPVQHTSSPQTQDARRFCPPTIRNTSLPHNPNVDYRFTYDPALTTPGTTAMFDSTAITNLSITTRPLDSTPIPTSSRSPTTWTAAMSIANEDALSFSSMQCINVSDHHAQTTHGFDTNYDHVTKAQAFVLRSFWTYQSDLD
ncbi:hypothetical protein EDB83DRAFT_2519512 [Lactarius deliciosus]|nr:hypothetical protein EDB83DRAFT_2519512 [Lactarius deliciosus]